VELLVADLGARKDARYGDEGWTPAEFLGRLEKLENYQFNANEKALKPD
jgi:hypothetical protein